MSLHAAYIAAHAPLVAEFWRHRDGLEYSRRHSAVVDTLARRAFAEAAALTPPPPCALVAVGGYGRGTLVPFSDLDLVLLYEDTNRDNALASFASRLFGSLWDIGFKVSHAARTAPGLLAAAASEQTIASAFVDARFLCGDEGIFTLCAGVFQAWLHGAGRSIFTGVKQAERARRAERYGTVYGALEPNLKESIGGLRDIHYLHWMAGSLMGAPNPESWPLQPKEHLALMQGWRFFAGLRTALHLLCTKAEEKLSLSWHPEIAARLSYRGEGVMATTRLRRKVWQHGIHINALAQTLPKRWAGEATSEDEAFLAAVLRRRPLDKPQPCADGLVFVKALTLGKMPLHPMAESGVLGNICPPFRHTEGLMQFDQVHTLTVDAHTLRAVTLAQEYWNGVHHERDPEVSALAACLDERRALVLAALFHDICKGKKGDHSTLGAAIVRQMGTTWKLPELEIETIAWLVENHLLMSFHAFKRDVHDVAALKQFTTTVQSVERLRLLYLLTVVDMQATNPGLYSSWKRSLLAQLYQLALAVLSGGLLAPTTKRRDSRALLAEQPLAASLLEQLPDSYFSAFTLEQQRRHLGLLLRHQQGETIAIDHQNYEELGFTEITLCTSDAPGLFARIVGAFAYAKADIVDARVLSLKDGVVLDSFAIQDSGKAYKFADQVGRLAEKIHSVLSGMIDPTATLAKLPKPAGHSSRVVVDNTSSPTDTILEVTCPDRPGLLYALATILREEKIQLSNAKIATFSGRAIDIFYIRDAYGFKITRAERLEGLKEKLLGVV
jgi:[protein-PII] uridylyltransferase